MFTLEGLSQDVYQDVYFSLSAYRGRTRSTRQMVIPSTAYQAPVASIEFECIGGTQLIYFIVIFQLIFFLPYYKNIPG